MSYFALKEVASAYKISTRTLKRRLKTDWKLILLNSDTKKRVRLLNSAQILYIEEKLGKTELLKTK